ncbi:MAG: hypothetical protein AAGA93_02785 [Actinomycetota bacterium]
MSGRAPTVRPSARIVLALLVAASLAGCSVVDEAIGGSPGTIGGRAVDTPIEPTEVGGDGDDGGGGSVVTDGPTVAPGADPVIEPVTLAGDVELLERDCFDGETRCGSVLVPQVEGGRDLVEVPFREWTDGRTGTPLVVLERTDLTLLTGDHVLDRPVVVLGDRGDWGAGPGLGCPLLDTIDDAAGAEAIGRLGASCRDWLADGGLHLAGAGLRARVGDVANALDALGHEAVSVVAAGIESDVVAGLAAATTVERVIHVNPSLPGDDPSWRSANVLLDTLGELWAQCEPSPGCEPAGPLADFFAAVGALDVDPLADPWDDGAEIDGSMVLGHVGRLTDPGRIGDLPDLHRALLDRDADTVRAFLGGGFASTGHELVTGCRIGPSTDGVGLPDGTPRFLADHVAEQAELRAAWCAGLGVEPTPRPAPLPGLVISTRSHVTSRPDFEVLGPVIVEPTVGRPTSDCLAVAIAAYLDDGRVDESACGSGMRFVRRDDPVVPVTATVVDEFDGTTLTLSAPGNWEESWPGYWARGADFADIASLWAYTWIDGDVDDVLDDLAWEYDIGDWIESTADVGGRTWRVARGLGYQTDGLVVAGAEVDGVTVVFELWGDPDELDTLVAQILEPAMASATVAIGQPTG